MQHDNDNHKSTLLAFIQGFDDEDTFVCRDRYHILVKSFKPLKVHYEYSMNHNLICIKLFCTELGRYWETLGTGAKGTASEIRLCILKVC